ncbi:hypothetical protein OS493_023286 [Desmophyllum pertusum]|uniref:Uncharacterized protein n=1 Tax=Desmophyllum pertusum TaxID=174260 RepID=A0A9W9YDW8_9CNID|nr:hypothetical protein OS493_023286 [Desmophyllum pertusum]
MEENYNEDVLSPSILATLSPLNTPYEDSGCSKDLDTSDKDGDENFDIPSYQPPKKDASPSGENGADSRNQTAKEQTANEAKSHRGRSRQRKPKSRRRKFPSGN